MASADAARDRGDPAHAAELYQRVVDQFPDSFGAWVQLGNMSKDSRAHERALNAYTQALMLRPDDADVFLQLGHLAKGQGKLDEARQWYARSDQIDPSLGHAARELAIIDVRRPEPAVAAWDAPPTEQKESSWGEKAEEVIIEYKKVFQAEQTEISWVDQGKDLPAEQKEEPWMEQETQPKREQLAPPRYEHQPSLDLTTRAELTYQRLRAAFEFRRA